jgi:tetratricopeptide (TPR) repeat protein
MGKKVIRQYVFFIVMLILSSKTFAQLPTQTTQSSSALNEVKESEESLKVIDAKIEEQLFNSSESTKELENLLSSRVRECSKDRSQCLNTHGWGPTSCVRANGNPLFAEKLWQTLFPFVGIGPFLGELSKCSSPRLPPNSFQFSIALQLMNHLKKGPQERFSFLIENWIKKTFGFSSTDLISLLKLIQAERRGFYGEQPVPTKTIWYAIKLPIEIINHENLKKYLSQKKDADVIADWLVELGFDSTLMGKTSEFSLLFEKYPELLLISAPDKYLRVLEVLCVDWIHTNKTAKCLEKLTHLEKTPNQNENFKRQLGQVLARVWHLRGKSEKSIEIILKQIEEAKKNNQKEYLIWMYYGLSTYYSSVGKNSEAEKYSSLFSADLMEKNVGLLEAIRFTSTQSILLEQGKCEESLKVGDEARAFFKVKAKGVVSESAWVDFFQLNCFVKMKDIKKSKAMYDQLLRSIDAMPSVHFLKFLSRALMNQLEGKYKKSDLDEVKKLIGNEHPEIARIEKFVGKAEIH